jgi:hypothetical protein
MIKKKCSFSPKELGGMWAKLELNHSTEWEDQFDETYMVDITRLLFEVAISETIQGRYENLTKAVAIQTLCVQSHTRWGRAGGNYLFQTMELVTQRLHDDCRMLQFSLNKRRQFVLTTSRNCLSYDKDHKLIFEEDLTPYVGNCSKGNSQDLATHKLIAESEIMLLATNELLGGYRRR